MLFDGVRRNGTVEGNTEEEKWKLPKFHEVFDDFGGLFVETVHIVAAVEFGHELGVEGGHEDGLVTDSSRLNFSILHISQGFT